MNPEIYRDFIGLGITDSFDGDEGLLWSKGDWFNGVVARVLQLLHISGTDTVSLQHSLKSFQINYDSNFRQMFTVISDKGELLFSSVVARILQLLSMRGTDTVSLQHFVTVISDKLLQEFQTNCYSHFKSFYLYLVFTNGQNRTQESTKVQFYFGKVPWKSIEILPSN